MGCGCEGRREWLLQNAPPFTHGFVRNFDGIAVAHSVLAGLITGIVLYFLFRSRVLSHVAAAV